MTLSLFNLAAAAHSSAPTWEQPRRTTPSSPLSKTLSLFALGIVAFPVQLGCVLIAMTIAYFFRYPRMLPKALSYEVAIADLIVRDKLSKTFSFITQHWWHPITEDLVLGGIPLANRDHMKQLQDLGIGAVCTILEDDEANKTTFISTPVSAKDWESAHIAYRRFSCPDMEAMDLSDLRCAVEWVRSQVLAGKKVYVHCKAGRGRSAAIIICYLIQYTGMTLEEATRCVSSKRSVLTLLPAQLDALHRFATRVLK